MPLLKARTPKSKTPEPRARVVLRRTNLPFREQFQLTPSRRGRQRRASSEPSHGNVSPWGVHAEGPETVQTPGPLEPTLAHVSIGIGVQISRLPSQNRSLTIVSLVAEKAEEVSLCPSWSMPALTRLIEQEPEQTHSSRFCPLALLCVW